MDDDAVSRVLEEIADIRSDIEEIRDEPEAARSPSKRRRKDANYVGQTGSTAPKPDNTDDAEGYTANFGVLTQNTEE